MKKSLFLLLIIVFLSPGCINQTMLPVLDPLPSWNNTAVKEAIIRYVQQISDPHSVLYTDTIDRVAVFDFDGTIMIEKPDYLQKVFKQVVPAFIPDPATYDTLVTAWYNTVKHPRLKRLYKACMYQPMLELLAFFEAHQIRNFICTGSDMDFIRLIARDLPVPPERIIGTVYHNDYDSVANEIIRTEDIHLACWKTGKPESIYYHIGNKPLIVIGNADGDIPMIRYAGKNPHPSLRMLILHDDMEREYAYSEGAEEAIRMAKAENWIRISMKNDFRIIFPPVPGELVGRK